MLGTLAIALLGSCHKATAPTAPVDRVVDTATTRGDSTPTSTETGETSGADTADTGGSSSATSEPVAPYTTIRGRTSAELGGQWDEFIGDHLALVGDLWGDGHDNIGTNGIGGAMFFRGLPGPGEVTTEIAATQVVDGVDVPHRAGDVDGDGHDDVWIAWWLFRGPLPATLNQRQDWHSKISSSGVAGFRVEGGFDADGDGHTDAVAFSNNHQAVVHYGPFLEGETRRGWYDDDVDPSLLTEVQTDCGSGEDHETGWVWPDLFGTGRDGLAVGNSFSGGLCLYGVHIFDLSGPRGRRLGHEDAMVYDDREGIWPGGDYDGDGVQDLYKEGTSVYLGPFSGAFPDDERDRAQTFDPPAAPIRPTGDMNGDGRPELLVWLSGPADVASEFWIVPSTHLGEDLPLEEVGVPIEAGPNVNFHFNHWVSGDLDGDGKAELIASNESAEVGGRIYIWRGEDFFPAGP